MEILLQTAKDYYKVIENEMEKLRKNEEAMIKHQKLVEKKLEEKKNFIFLKNISEYCISFFGEPENKGKTVGEYTYANSTYRGETQFGFQHGFGIIGHSDGETFVGYMNLDKIHGYGRYDYNDSYYRGNYSADDMNGFGIYVKHNDFMYFGMHVNDKFSGIGLLYQNGYETIGDFSGKSVNGFCMRRKGAKIEFLGFESEGKPYGIGFCQVDGDFVAKNYKKNKVQFTIPHTLKVSLFKNDHFTDVIVIVQ